MTDKERAKDFVATIINDPAAIIRWCKREIKAWNVVASETYDKQISDWALLQKESYEELIKLLEEEVKKMNSEHGGTTRRQRNGNEYGAGFAL